MSDKALAVVELAESKMGDPYVFGARGEICTPKIRRQYASYNPQYKEKIYSACPVLSGKQYVCEGCKWEGHNCYDCRGFTYHLLKIAAGISLEGGALRHSTALLPTGQYAARSPTGCRIWSAACSSSGKAK